jgi:molecular chaperone GrpE
MTMSNEQDVTVEQQQPPADGAAPEAQQQQQAPEQAASPEQEVQALRAALEAAEARAAESRDLYLRALAELDNVRKRAAREIEQAHKFALERFANELIGVRDALELGLVSEGDVEALRVGTESTLKLLTKAFEKVGLFEIDPRGEVFNPELHEAMVAQPSSEHEPNTVIQVIQKGYQLNGRLLRPARVIVAKEA